MDLRPHKQTTLKCIEEKKKQPPPKLLLILITICLHSKYILDGFNSLLNKGSKFNILSI